MGLLKGNPRNQSLLLCLVTCLIGVGFVATYLRWDIPAEVAKNRTRPAAPVVAATTSVPTPPPSPGGAPVPDPAPSADNERVKAALLSDLQTAFVQLQRIEADILTSGATERLTAAGHFFLSKPAGGDIDVRQIRLRVSFSAVPVTEMLLTDEIVSVYQPTRQFAVRREAEAAVEDWLKDYTELTQNIDVTLIEAGDPKAGKRPALAIVPRQPKNIKRAVISIDPATHLPVHFEIQFPLDKQLVAFANMKVDQPVAANVFRITLPAGMKWTSR